MAIVIPLITAIVFISLFANANPLIAQFMGNIDWSFFSKLPPLSRLSLWVLIALPCWALIRARLRITNASITEPSTAPKILDKLFTKGSLFGSLILFNGLFFIQNFLDILFLWSTDTLPQGLTYAEYAHQGAYPLLATVILAAAYVLIALHPKADTAGRVKALVIVWISGFAATQMAMYHSASGNRDFVSTGSFTLTHPSGKSWSYDLPELVQLLAIKADASPYHLIACEPNWIYPLCNMIGASAIKAQAPDIWEKQQDRFRHHLEYEFMDVNGRIIPCRSRYTGLAFPVIGGTMPQALPCLFLNSLFPDIAMRQWLMLRKQAMNGNCLNPASFWRIDTGNYHCHGAVCTYITADTDGNASIPILLYGRVKFELYERG